MQIIELENRKIFWLDFAGKEKALLANIWLAHQMQYPNIHVLWNCVLLLGNTTTNIMCSKLRFRSIRSINIESTVRWNELMASFPCQSNISMAKHTNIPFLHSFPEMSAMLNAVLQHQQSQNINAKTFHSYFFFLLKPHNKFFDRRCA